MFLKSLEIFGFKSFPDRVKIEFADGITALLGPNGCGKSNVVDAVKWVLGEQSSRTLRADKMEDVIFNGTEKRNQLNVAEVTLTISNEKGLLNLDLSEIAIKRRLYRSGESEYFINNQSAKLREIRELFWDTGVGKAAYSVMEQGKIDQILSSKPEERRYLFEEAAGITKFKIKRQDAERKLEKTQENMKQIEAALAEVRRSYDTLKIQSEQTIKYRELKDSVFEHERDIQLLRLKSFVDSLAAKKQSLKEASEKRDSIQAQIDGIHGLLSENMDIVNEMEEKFNAYRTKVLNLAIEQKGKQEQVQIYNKRRSELKLKLNQLEAKTSSIKENIESLEDDISEKNADVFEFKKQVSAIEKNAEDFEKNIDLAGHKITSNKAAVKVLEDDIKRLDDMRGDMELELKSITEDIVTELDKNLRSAGYSSANKLQAEKELDETLNRLRVLIAGKKAIFSDFASIENHSADDVKKFAEDSVQSFSSLLSISDEIQNSLEKYKKSSAGFIDEFLAPEGIITKKRAVDTAILENRQSIENNRAKIAELIEENNELSIKINDYRKTLEDLRVNRAKVDAQAKNAEDQVKLLERQLSSEKKTLHDLENEFFTEEKQLKQTEEDISELEGEINSLEYEGRKINAELEKLENEISIKNSDLASKRGKVDKLTAELSKANSLLEKFHLDIAGIEADIRNTKENFREKHSRELMEFEERMFTLTSSVSELRDSLSNIKQKLDSLGRVNFMAPEEFESVKERYEFLTKHISDLDKARADLQRITDEITAESTELFLDTYNKIKKNFHNMFRRLFGGGRAEIRLTDPKNVLESGIEIFAQPPGKKLENISLLSGGEKSMTAVALLFATYMVKPSPFCLLDEIDAALDEQNVTRFVTTLREFANVSQYIVITHNKKTVLGANAMLGVTMEESGVSKVIAIRLDNESNLESKTMDLVDEPFVEEDVEPEEGVYIPPHPPKRIKTVNDEEEIPENDDRPQE
ncbi:AAA family ATPase [Treponema putidum]|uniref:AAA family ATPase n=1 Tax=Treponema putidum TaxID=221027 RepID=UPI0021084D53|nr:AAA family ATPase [Treponema putidum]UTY31132.1 chromosome segregation protein SMC [Treponema putidum]